MPDIILEHLEKVICHTDEEVRNKRTAIDTYKLIKKKLTPMKTIYIDNWRPREWCPSCEERVSDEYDYCPNCGQAIERDDNDG